MARRWSGQWDQAAIRSLQPQIARCTRKQIKAVLGYIGRITSSTASACWRDFTAMARELSPPTAHFPTPTPVSTDRGQYEGHISVPSRSPWGVHRYWIRGPPAAERMQSQSLCHPALTVEKSLSIFPGANQSLCPLWPWRCALIDCRFTSRAPFV